MDLNRNIDLRTIPINALSQKTRSTLSKGLNKKKVLLSECGDNRDWRGIVKNIGLPDFSPSVEMNAMEEVLNFLSSNHMTDVTLGRFQEIFQIIDRYDVYDDTLDCFYEDARNYTPAPYKVPTSTENGILVRRNSIEYASEDETSEDEDEFDNKEAFTYEDKQRLQAGLRLERYRAFILCSDNTKDVEFANKIKENLRGHGLRVIDKNSLLPGTFELDAIMRIIASRCDRLIVVLSKTFLKQSASKFYVKFGQWRGIEKDTRKVIPCKYENIRLPSSLAFYTVLHYNMLSYDDQFWRKLETSLLPDDIPIPVAAIEAPRPFLPLPAPASPLVHNLIVEHPSQSNNQTSLPALEQRLAIEPATPEHSVQSGDQHLLPEYRAIEYNPTLLPPSPSTSSPTLSAPQSFESVSTISQSSQTKRTHIPLSKQSRSAESLNSVSEMSISSDSSYNETKSNKKTSKIRFGFLNFRKVMKKSKSKKEKSKKFNDNDRATKSD